MTRHKGRVKKSEEQTPSAPSPMSQVTLAERKLRVRSMLPVTLDYEPFASPANMKRLEELSEAGNTWIPSWLRTVGSREELAEWSAIYKARRGRDLRERTFEFIHEMRKKHPDMPLSFEEQMEAGVEKLRKDVEWQKREGLIRESPTIRT